LNGIPDKRPEEAWAIIKKASDEEDLEDFREVRFSNLVPLWYLPSAFILQGLTKRQALKIYSKAVPDATFVDIENKLRQDNSRFYLIAMVSGTTYCYFVFSEVLIARMRAGKASGRLHQCH
jgi:hypothetical protein